MTLPAPKLLLATAALVLAGLAIAALPSAAPARDRDCRDFSSQRAAQLFFIKHGGPRYDPDRLDGDDDGVACEDNPCPCYFKKHLPRRPNPGAGPADRLRLGVPSDLLLPT
jgi:hypothetical protein